MVFFTNSGAEGIETALKYARCATRRPAILHCEKAFHGLTYGALSINGDESFRAGFEPFLSDCRKIPFNDLEALERELHRGDVAAFVVEPIQGKGVNIPSPGYLREAAKLCHKHGALYVDDEVQTGMGRTGRFLAIEHDGDVDADIVVLAKTLSGGFVPVGAVLCKQWIHDKVFSSMNRSVVHSSTFSQGSFAMAAGLAALDVLDRHRLIEQAEAMGRLLAEGLRALVPRFEFLKEIRARGLMVGIEFGAPRSLGLKAAWTMAHKLDKSLFPQAAIIPLLDKHHIITQVAGHHIDVIKLIPPLVISAEDVKWFLTAFEDVLVQMHKFPGPGLGRDHEHRQNGVDQPGALNRTMNPLRSKLEQTLGWAVLLALVAGCLIVLRPFVSALLWAVVLSFASWPVYRRLLSLLGNRRTLAALVMTLGMVLILLLPFLDCRHDPRRQRQRTYGGHASLDCRRPTCPARVAGQGAGGWGTGGRILAEPGGRHREAMEGSPALH